MLNNIMLPLTHALSTLTAKMESGGNFCDKPYLSGQPMG